MTKKIQLFWLVLIFIVSISFLVVRSNKPPAYRKGTSSIQDSVVHDSTVLYRERADEGTNFSSGPCLTNDLRPGWVVDTVHNPRQAIDDLPQNQCPAYLEGRADHIVELDINGDVVRVR